MARNRWLWLGVLAWSAFLVTGVFQKAHAGIMSSVTDGTKTTGQDGGGTVEVDGAKAITASSATASYTVENGHILNLQSGSDSIAITGTTNEGKLVVEGTVANKDGKIRADGANAKVIIKSAGQVKNSETGEMGFKNNAILSNAGVIINSGKIDISAGTYNNGASTSGVIDNQNGTMSISGTQLNGGGGQVVQDILRENTNLGTVEVSNVINLPVTIDKATEGKLIFDSIGVTVGDVKLLNSGDKSKGVEFEINGGGFSAIATTQLTVKSGTNTIAGKVTSNTGITVDSSDTTTFDGDLNDVEGDIIVNAGTTKFSKDITSGKADITIAGGSTETTFGGAMKAKDTITVSGGENTFTGNVSFNADNTGTNENKIDLSGGKTTFKGTVDAKDISISGPAATQGIFEGAVTASGAIDIAGGTNQLGSTTNADSLLISGAATENTFTGTVTVKDETKITGGDNKFKDVTTALDTKSLSISQATGSTTKSTFDTAVKVAETTTLSGGTNTFSTTLDTESLSISRDPTDTTSKNSFGGTVTASGATTITGGTNEFNGATTSLTTDSLSISQATGTASKNDFANDVEVAKTAKLTGGTNTFSKKFTAANTTLGTVGADVSSVTNTFSAGHFGDLVIESGDNTFGTENIAHSVPPPAGMYNTNTAVEAIKSVAINGGKNEFYGTVGFGAGATGTQITVKKGENNFYGNVTANQIVIGSTSGTKNDATNAFYETVTGAITANSGTNKFYGIKGDVVLGYKNGNDDSVNNAFHSALTTDTTIHALSGTNDFNSTVASDLTLEGGKNTFNEKVTSGTINLSGGTNTFNETVASNSIAISNGTNKFTKEVGQAGSDQTMTLTGGTNTFDMTVNEKKIDIGTAGTNIFTGEVTAADGINILAGTTTNTFNDVNGNYSSDGGTTTIEKNVNGDFTVTGGTTKIGMKTDPGNISGNFTVTGGTAELGAKTEFTNAGTKTFTLNGGAIDNKLEHGLNLSAWQTVSIGSNTNTKIINKTGIAFNGSQAANNTIGNAISAAARGDSGDFGNINVTDVSELADNVIATGPITKGTLTLGALQTTAKSVDIGGGHLEINGDGSTPTGPNVFDSITAAKTTLGSDAHTNFTGTVNTDLYMNGRNVTFANTAHFTGGIETGDGKLENSGELTIASGKSLDLTGNSKNVVNNAIGKVNFEAGSKFTAGTGILQNSGIINVNGKMESSVSALVSNTALSVGSQFNYYLEGVGSNELGNLSLNAVTGGGKFSLLSGAAPGVFDMKNTSNFNMGKADFAIGSGVTLQYGADSHGGSTHKITAANTILGGGIDFTDSQAKLDVIGDLNLDGAVLNYKADSSHKNQITVTTLPGAAGTGKLTLSDKATQFNFTGDFYDVYNQNVIQFADATGISAADMSKLSGYLFDDNGNYLGLKFNFGVTASGSNNYLTVNGVDSLIDSLGAAIGAGNYNSNTATELAYLDNAFSAGISAITTSRSTPLNRDTRLLDLVTTIAYGGGRALDQYSGLYGVYASTGMREGNSIFFDKLDQNWYANQTLGFYNSIQNWQPAAVGQANRAGGNAYANLAPNTRTGNSRYLTRAPRYEMPAGNLRIWANYVGNWATQRSKSNLAGYSVDANGFVLGGEYTLGNFQFGLTTSYMDAKTKVKDLSTKYDTDIFNLALSASYTHESGFFARAAMGYGHGWNDYTASMYGGGKRDGEFDSDTFTLMGELGYIFRLPNNMNIIPSVGLNYTHFHNSDWTENIGGGALFANWYDTKNENAVDIPLAVRFTRIFDLGNVLIAPQAKVGWTVAVNKTTPSVTTGYAGVPGAGAMVLHGIKPKTNRFTLGAGVSARFGSHWDANLNYDFEFHGKYTSHNLTLGVGYSF